MPDKPEHVDRLEFVRSFVGHEDNLRIFGHLYASRTGRTVGGWLVSSWSDHGAPYWSPEQHWFDRGENKFYHAVFNIDRRSIDLHSEDKDIHPNRVAFIRKVTGKWESEWLQGHQDGPG